MLIKGSHCIVESVFDRGNFLHFKISSSETEINQYCTKPLSKEDIDVIGFLLANETDNYLSKKESSVFNN